MIETNHYQYFDLGEGDAIRFEFYSPTDGTATVSLRARRRSSAPRIVAHLQVNGVDFPIAEGETARDEYREIVRAGPLRAGSNEVSFETGAALELARFVAYTAPLSTLLDRFTTAYTDPDTVILTPR